MSAKLHELIEKATPGPWVAAESGTYNDIVIRTPDRPNRIPRYQMVAEAWTKNGMPQEVATANAQLIARCSPDTMKAVLEALEQIADPHHTNRPVTLDGASLMAEKALRRLNGESP